MTAAVLAVLALIAAGAVWTAYTRSEGTRRGLAPGMTIVETMSATAVRRRALHTRPETRTTWRTRAQDVGIELGRAGWRWLFASLEDVVLYIAGPRTGKTGGIARHIQDAPGAVLATSTKPDLYLLTKTSRGQRPVWVFTPDHIGGLESTLRWSPVHGSRSPRHAALVAALLVSAGDSNSMRDAKFWESNAVRALRCLLAAADLDDADMHTVARWCSLTDDRPVAILRAHADAPKGWASELRTLLDDSTPDNTRGSIATTLANCVAFMSDPVLAHAATPERHEHFDADHWLRTGGTVHAIGTHRDHAPVGPLFAAFVGWLNERVTEVSSRRRGGRLDPPALMVLDEVAKTFRAPVPQWTSDNGSRGIPTIIAAQDRHQLREAFGDEGAATIWGNASTKVILGGQSDPELLRDVAELCGSRAVEFGSKARRPVLEPADIRNLRPQRAVVLTRWCPPVIARIPMVWDRKNPPVARSLVEDEQLELAPVVRLDDHRRSA